MYLGVSEEHFFHVTACEFVQFLVSGKDDDGDFSSTKHGQFKGLLEEPILSFQKGHLHSISTLDSITRTGSTALFRSSLIGRILIFFLPMISCHLKNNCRFDKVIELTGDEAADIKCRAGKTERDVQGCVRTK